MDLLSYESTYVATESAPFFRYLNSNIKNKSDKRKDFLVSERLTVYDSDVMVHVGVACGRWRRL